MYIESARISLVFAAILAIAAPRPALAKPPPTADDVRTEGRALLQSICGWQCDLTDVAIKNKPASAPGGALPGFDETPAERQIPGAIELGLLMDQKLTAAFRTFVTERLRSRIGEWGLPVTITPRVTPFPDRPTPPSDERDRVEPPRPTPEPTMAPASAAPQPIIIQPPAPAAPAPGPDPRDALFGRLLEAIPLLLLGLLLAFTVLAIMRRYENFLSAAPPEDAQKQGGGAEPAVREKAPPPDLRVLREALLARRAGTRRIFAELVQRGDHELVARAVALLGEGILRDLGRDPAHRAPLLEIGRKTQAILETSQSQEAQEEALAKISGLLTADRVAHPIEPLPAALEGLLGLGPNAFAALVERQEGRARALLLKYGPAHLVTTFFDGLAPAERAKVALEIAATRPGDPSEMQELSQAVASELPGVELAELEVERLAALLERLPADEQDRMLESLGRTRPELLRRNAQDLPVESLLLSADPQAIGLAFAELPLEEWAAYLRVAPEAIKKRVVEACPERLRAGLAEELGLRVEIVHERAMEARRRVLRTVLSMRGRVDALRLANPVKTPQNGRREVKG
ncbi:MAG: FliG C-terminal domain-containing protein [Myxococcota bacterium]